MEAAPNPGAAFFFFTEANTPRLVPGLKAGVSELLKSKKNFCCELYFILYLAYLKNLYYNRL